MDVKAAVLFVLKQEDANLTGVITNDPADTGGTTRFGLTAKWHPELVSQLFFTDQIPADRALVMAQAAYESTYAHDLHLQDFKSQAIGTALLSFAVLEGTRKAVQLLQEALSFIGLRVAADGVLGDRTIGAANAANPPDLLQAWIALENDYFDALVTRNPTQARFVQGWKNRAAKLTVLL